jgi:hypothetical protein
MKKKVNTDAIVSELEGSVFFRQPGKKLEEEIGNKSANQQNNISTNQQVDTPSNQIVNKSPSQQADLSSNQQMSKSPNQQTSKILKRFGSYLTYESLKELKRIAFETERKDYEVLQEAVNMYLERMKK